jgi:ATP-dependent exoDNAse (exonuclease V) alpha subunit
MKVMVTQNVKTDLDITNGARGTIVNIILDKDKPPLLEMNIVELVHLPAYILVQLDQTHITQLEGLPPCVIPVGPPSKSFTITVMVDGKPQNHTVKRHQFPMTAAYAFTNYQLQGQTISHILVNIASPPTGGLSLFNLYIALSQSSGCSTIHLLRDFDDDTFKARHDPELLAEDDRLDYLDKITKKWWEQIRLERE